MRWLVLLVLASVSGACGSSDTVNDDNAGYRISQIVTTRAQEGASPVVQTCTFSYKVYGVDVTQPDCVCDLAFDQGRAGYTLERDADGTVTGWQKSGPQSLLDPPGQQDFYMQFTDGLVTGVGYTQVLEAGAQRVVQVVSYTNGRPTRIDSGSQDGGLAVPQVLTSEVFTSFGYENEFIDFIDSRAYGESYGFRSFSYSDGTLKQVSPIAPGLNPLPPVSFSYSEGRLLAVADGARLDELSYDSNSGLLVEVRATNGDSVDEVVTLSYERGAAPPMNVMPPIAYGYLFDLGGHSQSTPELLSEVWFSGRALWSP